MKSSQLSTLSKLPKILVIVGPTASGKTDLAIKLAEEYNGEIVSADSRQIYRGMDIGTAKPTKIEQEKIKHRLIDVKNPNQLYTVAQYKKDALGAIGKILKSGKLPILVGGTGLYIKAIVDNLEIPEVKPSHRLRNKLEKELKNKGLDYIYKKLIGIDPEAAYIIDRHNPRRIIRALEIIYGSGTLFSRQRKAGEKLFDALKIGINTPKGKLREKIDKRVDKMIRDGLIGEVKNLIKKYPAELPAFDAIGYREIIFYLQNAELHRHRMERGTTQKNQRESVLSPRESTYSLDEAVNEIKRNTWQYAKRQVTWFKKDKEIIWINPHARQGLKIAAKLCAGFLK